MDRAVRRAGWMDPVSVKLAIADFDRDQKADGAVLLRPNLLKPFDSYRVRVHLSDRPDVELTFNAPGSAVGVSARDIDHDQDDDLVLEHSFTAKRVKVWINDGRGGFREGRVEDYPGPDDDGPLKIGAPRYQNQVLAVIQTTQRPYSLGVSSSPEAICPPAARSVFRSGRTKQYRPVSGRDASPPRAPPSLPTLHPTF